MSIFIFFIIEKYGLASYTDDTDGSETTANVILNLEKLLKNLFQCFYLNQMKRNPNKCNLLLSTSEKITMNVKDLNAINSKSEKLLGIALESNLCIQIQI